MKQKLTSEQKAQNELNKKIERKKAQKPVKSIDIAIEWKKSRMYGFNPTLTAKIFHTDGEVSQFTSKCSGYGYDKESTVIADLFNNCLSYKLYEIDLNAEKIPYGISKHQQNDYRYFAGGIGTNCYYDISAFIGGQFKCVGSGKSFDCYTFNF